MTTEMVEALDAALDDPTSRPLDDEIGGLLDVATHVRNALRSITLDAESRRLLYARALAQQPSRRNLLQRLGWRAPAILGGGLVTAGAVAAIVVARSRGRRQGQLPIPA